LNAMSGWAEHLSNSRIETEGALNQVGNTIDETNVELLALKNFSQNLEPSDPIYKDCVDQ